MDAFIYSEIFKNLNLNTETQAFVMIPSEVQTPNTKEDDDKKIGAFIPHLMQDIEMETAPYEKGATINDGVLLNDNIKIKFGSPNECNYIYVTPTRFSNFEQAPLQEGEPFYVRFKDGDVKKGRYTMFGTHEYQRTKDRFRLFVVDKQNIGDDNLEWELLFDTELGIVRIATNNGRGEEAIYKFEIDAINQTITLADDLGQEFLLNTPNKEWIIKNSEDSIITMKEKDISLICAGNIILESDGLKVKNTSMSVEGDSLEVKESTFKLQSDAQEIKGTEIKVNTTLFDVKSSQTKIAGMVLHSDSTQTTQAAVGLMKYPQFNIMMKIMCTFIDTHVHPAPGSPLVVPAPMGFSNLIDFSLAEALMTKGS